MAVCLPLSETQFQVGPMQSNRARRSISAWNAASLSQCPVGQDAWLWGHYYLTVFSEDNIPQTMLEMVQMVASSSVCSAVPSQCMSLSRQNHHVLQSKVRSPLSLKMRRHKFRIRWGLCGGNISLPGHKSEDPQIWGGLAFFKKKITHLYDILGLLWRGALLCQRQESLRIVSRCPSELYKPRGKGKKDAFFLTLGESTEQRELQMWQNMPNLKTFQLAMTPCRLSVQYIWNISGLGS